LKNQFKSFYKLNKDEYQKLWENALFVFDTNILLNLYRYQSSTRDELLKVIEKLSQRVWIPNHVALEFQRNRLSVIAEQHKRYSEVRNIVSKSITGMQNELEGLQLKKRHSHINPDKLLDSMQEVKKLFFDELEKLEEQSISLSSSDQILDRLDALFSNKVGVPFPNQDELEKLFKLGDERFKKQIPPGFKDAHKDDKKPDDFTFGGLAYKRKFGDLIVWTQIKEYAKEKKLQDIIFITDDGKSDWWWKIESNGSKTIGARPELIDEIYREANVERFSIYNTEKFLNYANELLNAKVAEEAIQEVREVSHVRRIVKRGPRALKNFALSTERTVLDWLSRYFDNIESNQKGFPDFVAYQGDMKYGFEVRAIRDFRMALHRLDEILHRAYYAMNEDGYDEMSIIFVVFEDESVDRIIHTMHRRISEFHGNLKIIIGRAEYDEETETVYDFEPYEEFRTSRDM
jgi:hypothetical protein